MGGFEGAVSAVQESSSGSWGVFFQAFFHSSGALVVFFTHFSTGPAPGGVLFRAFFHSSGALVVLFTHFSTGSAPGIFFF